MTFEWYFFAKLFHILVFVYWLGGDIGVFHSASYLRKRELSPEQRRVALNILAWIDMIPRYCLVLMLPAGYTLAASIGVVKLRPGWLEATYLLSFIWLALVWAVHHYQGTARGETLRKIDLVWRCILVPGFLYDAITGFAGTGHLLTPWLNVKAGIYGLCILCGICIRVRGRPMAGALQELFTRGSSPELEQRIVTLQGRTRPFVIAIWVLLLAAAWVGISKPMFGL